MTLGQAAASVPAKVTVNTNLTLGQAAATVVPAAVTVNTNLKLGQANAPAPEAVTANKNLKLGAATVVPAAVTVHELQAHRQCLCEPSHNPGRPRHVNQPADSAFSEDESMSESGAVELKMLRPTELFDL